MTNIPAIFVADAPGLDFLNSIATPNDMEVEWLDSGEGLLRWLADAEMVDETVLEDFRRNALPGELDAIAAQARGLREWFRDFVARNQGTALKVEDFTLLDPINRILARDEQYLQIAAEEGDSGLRLERRRRWRSSEALLLPIAEAMAEVIGGQDFRKILNCEGHSCTLVFLDSPRGPARRWCSMAVCGNRAKQAAHRDRTTASRH
ncbi:CGNR zinc finger domain-containing protein [Sphingopyxis panaciterrae]